jgi:hypothetical protein
MTREMRIDMLSSCLTEEEKVLAIAALRYYFNSPMQPSSPYARRIKALIALLSEAV